MMLSLLKMALLIRLPLMLVTGTYDLKTVVTLSCVQFAWFFVDVWVQLARQIDLPPDNRALWPREFRLQGGQVGTHPESNRLANYAV